MSRPEGLYWVTLRAGMKPQPAEWVNDNWWTIGSEEPRSDRQIYAVGEKLEVPPILKAPPARDRKRAAR